MLQTFFYTLFLSWCTVSRFQQRLDIYMLISSINLSWPPWVSYQDNFSSNGKNLTKTITYDFSFFFYSFISFHKYFHVLSSYKLSYCFTSKHFLAFVTLESIGLHIIFPTVLTFQFHIFTHTIQTSFIHYSWPRITIINSNYFLYLGHSQQV